MELPATFPELTRDDRLAARSIRLGLFLEGEASGEHVLPCESDVSLGASTASALVVPGWEGADICLVASGRWLGLGPGMSVHMVDETGEDRMRGSYEELLEAGVDFPFFINVSRLNIRVRPGVVLLMEYTRPA